MEDSPRHRIAIDRHGLPALLIGVIDADVTGPPLVLEHIRMQQAVDCRVTDGAGRLVAEGNSTCMVSQAHRLGRRSRGETTSTE